MTDDTSHIAVTYPGSSKSRWFSQRAAAPTSVRILRMSSALPMTAMASLAAPQKKHRE